MLFFKSFTAISIGIIALIFGWYNLFISEEIREVSPFHVIHTAGPINVFLKEGGEESVVVRADDKFMKQVIVEVVNGKLNVYTKGAIRQERVLDVYVTYSELDSIHVDGSSTLTGRSIVQNTAINLQASGAAEVKLQIESDTLDLLMEGSANVQLAGEVDYFDFHIKQFGDLMAYNLFSQHCRARIYTGPQSPGIARVHALETLDVEIKGPRLLKYKGEPAIVHQLVEGKGKVSRR